MLGLPKLRKFWWLTLVWVLAFSGAAAGQKQFPRPTGWVGDFAEVIEEADEQKISELATNLEQETTAELAVLTITSLEGGSIEDYAVRLFEQWGIGKKDKDNGVLLLLAIQDRQWRIEVGYGLEPILPDGLCGEIGRKQMVPLLKKGKYGEAAYAGAYRIAEIILSKAGQPCGPYGGTGVLGERPTPPRSLGEVFFEKVGYGLLALVIAFIVCFFSEVLIESGVKPWESIGVAERVFWCCFGLALGVGFLVFIPKVIGWIGWFWGVLYALVGALGFFVALRTPAPSTPIPRYTGTRSRWWASTSSTGGSGGFSGGGGGGFGGFGGGSSGGGGASGGW